MTYSKFLLLLPVLIYLGLGYLFFSPLMLTALTLILLPGIFLSLKYYRKFSRHLFNEHTDEIICSVLLSLGSVLFVHLITGNGYIVIPVFAIVYSLYFFNRGRKAKEAS